MKTIILLATAVALSGCTTTRQPPPISPDGFCALGIFYPEDNADERWTEAEMRNLVARNETTEQLCGIKP